MTAPEQLRPPVYGCAAGTVLHGHAADTLEPGILLYTFLPPGVADALRTTEPRVDVHADGPQAQTVTVRVLVGETALTWQLPLPPFVAALPGQSGEEGRMVLLAVVDAEPESSFWTEPVDCERLAAELQLPVAELAEALRGRLTPWLDEDLRLLLDDDAYHRAADRSPAQGLADAVVAQYRGDLEAERALSRLLRALSMAPPAHSAEIGARLSAALVTAVDSAPADTHRQVLEQTGPFEGEVLRLLGELPELLRTTPPGDRADAALNLLLLGNDMDETVRGALSVITRLVRAVHGPDLSSDELLEHLGMVDDAGLVRLAGLWVALAAAADSPATEDPANVPLVAEAIRRHGVQGGRWLQATAASLTHLAEEHTGRAVEKVAAELAALRTQPDSGDLRPAVGACLSLARFVRAKARSGPGSWLDGPGSAAVAAVMTAYADGLEHDIAVDLLAELLVDDVTGPELLDAFVCATAQLLTAIDPDADEVLRRAQVGQMLADLSSGARGSRWLLAACLVEAAEHDPRAADLSALVPGDAVSDPDRAAEKVGALGLLRAGLPCLDALSNGLGVEAHAEREDVLVGIFPHALIEHGLVRDAASH